MSPCKAPGASVNVPACAVCPTKHNPSDIPTPKSDGIPTPLVAEWCETTSGSCDFGIGCLLIHGVFPSTISHCYSVTRMSSRYSYPFFALHRFAKPNRKFEKIHHHRIHSIRDALFIVTKNQPLGGFDAFGKTDTNIGNGNGAPSCERSI